jgi:hypothetical protein
MEAVLAFLTGPIGRYLLTLGGGWLLKNRTTFTHRAIPLVTLGANILLALVNGLVPAMANAAADSMAAVRPEGHGGGQPWWLTLLIQTLVPWLAAVGTHSSARNTVQLLKREPPA